MCFFLFFVHFSKSQTSEKKSHEKGINDQKRLRNHLTAGCIWSVLECFGFSPKFWLSSRTSNIKKPWSGSFSSGTLYFFDVFVWICGIGLVHLVYIFNWVVVSNVFLFSPLLGEDSHFD